MAEKTFINYQSLVDFESGHKGFKRAKIPLAEAIIAKFEAAVRALPGAQQAYFVYTADTARAASLEHLNELALFINRLRLELFSGAPVRQIHVSSMSDGSILLAFNTLQPPAADYVRLVRKTLLAYGITVSMVQDGDLQLRTSQQFIDTHQVGYQEKSQSTQAQTSIRKPGRSHAEV